MAKERKRKRSYQKEKTWEAFSMYIRLRDADSNGYCICISCRKIKHWREMQAGHLIPGRSNGILFDEELVFAQCPECNRNKGEQALFWRNLKAMMGYSDDDFDRLMQRKSKTIQYKQHDLYDIEKIYLNKIDKIIRLKGIII